MTRQAKIRLRWAATFACLLMLFLLSFRTWAPAREVSLLAARLAGQKLFVEYPEGRLLQAQAGYHIEVPVKLHNLASQETKLFPQRLPCSRTTLVDVPKSVHGGETAQFRLVINTNELNGVRYFPALISTNGDEPRELRVGVTVEVHAQEVTRRVDLGFVRTGAREFRREITVADLPADSLVHLGQPSDHNWSVAVAEAHGRGLKLAISGQVPELSVGQSRRRAEFGFALDFSAPELSRAQVIVSAWVVPEWEFPAFIAVNPLNTVDGYIVFFVLHRPARSDHDASQIEAADNRQARIQVDRGGLSIDETSTSPSWPTRRFRVKVRVRDLVLPSNDRLRLRLVNENVSRLIEIPVVVTGRPG